MLNLEAELRRLVEEFGIATVHDVLREMYEYCDNCGCPITSTELHTHAALGMCYINKAGGF